jgi:phage terminase small subunit
MGLGMSFETIPAPTKMFLEVPVPDDEGRMGPAMLALPPRMRAFVAAVMETGGRADKYVTAARMAGYGETQSDASLKVTASRMAHDPRVLEAIREESHNRLKSGLALSASRLVEIIQDEMTSKKDAISAAKVLFDRAGLPSQTEQKVTVTHIVSDADIKKRITELATQLGMDPAQLLGQNVIEGEFVEIEDQRTGAEGLEDIL